VGFRDYLHIIYPHSLFYVVHSLYHPLWETLIMEFVCQDPSADNITMFEFTESAEKCLGLPGEFPVMGSNKFVTKISTYTNCEL
jgi:hypothetical protein